MCKIPLNTHPTPVHSIEPDIQFSEEEAEVSWSEYDSTVSSSINMDTSGSSDQFYSSASDRTFASTATSNSEEDFCGFTEGELSYEDVDVTDYYEDSRFDEEYLEVDDSIDDMNSEIQIGEILDWSNVPFDDEDFCQCHCEDDDLSSLDTSDTLDLADFAYDYYAECEEAVSNIPFEENEQSSTSNSSTMLDFYQDQIAECAQDVFSSKDEFSDEIHVQQMYEDAIVFELNTIQLPGEPLKECYCNQFQEHSNENKFFLFEIEDQHMNLTDNDLISIQHQFLFEEYDSMNTGDFNETTSLDGSLSAGAHSW